MSWEVGPRKGVSDGALHGVLALVLLKLSLATVRPVGLVFGGLPGLDNALQREFAFTGGRESLGFPGTSSMVFLS